MYSLFFLGGGGTKMDISEWADGELRGKIVNNQKLRKYWSPLKLHITIQLTLKVELNPSRMTAYFILGWNRWNVWFGMNEGSEPPGCILYLTSFSSEYTCVLFNGPNGHWVTPGQPSNTLFKSHNTQAQDFWTRRARLIRINNFNNLLISQAQRCFLAVWASVCQCKPWVSGDACF